MDENPIRIAKKLRFQAPFRAARPLLLDFFGSKKGGMTFGSVRIGGR